MIYRNLASGRIILSLIVSLICAHAEAQQSGKVTFKAGEIASLAETYLRLPAAQIVIQQSKNDREWENTDQIIFSVGAHPNRSGSTDTTEFRIAPSSGRMALVYLEFRVDGICVDNKTVDASSDLLTWLQKPTPDHYYSTLAVTPRKEMLAGERSGLGFFFAAEENQIFSQYPTVGSTHYVERYARALTVGLPRGALMDDPKYEGGEKSGLELLAKEFPNPAYVEFVTKGGAELLAAVNAMNAELLDHIMQKAASEGIVPSEIAVEQLKQKRLKLSGDPNPPNLRQYLAPFLAEKAAAAKAASSLPPVSATPSQVTPAQKQPSSAPAEAPKQNVNSSGRWMWIAGAIVILAILLWWTSIRRR